VPPRSISALWCSACASDCCTQAVMSVFLDLIHTLGWLPYAAITDTIALPTRVLSVVEFAGLIGTGPPTFMYVHSLTHSLTSTHSLTHIHSLTDIAHSRMRTLSPSLSNTRTHTHAYPRRRRRRRRRRRARTHTHTQHSHLAHSLAHSLDPTRRLKGLARPLEFLQRFLHRALPCSWSGAPGRC
jgi:hypothetical protein